jgi:hypothetical protein
MKQLENTTELCPSISIMALRQLLPNRLRLMSLPSLGSPALLRLFHPFVYSSRSVSNASGERDQETMKG